MFCGNRLFLQKDIDFKTFATIVIDILHSDWGIDLMHNDVKQCFWSWKVHCGSCSDAQI